MVAIAIQALKQGLLINCNPLWKLFPGKVTAKGIEAETINKLPSRLEIDPKNKVTCDSSWDRVKCSILTGVSNKLVPGNNFQMGLQ